MSCAYETLLDLNSLACANLVREKSLQDILVYHYSPFTVQALATVVIVSNAPEIYQQGCTLAGLLASLPHQDSIPSP